MKIHYRSLSSLLATLSLALCGSAPAQDIHPSLKTVASKINTAGDHISMTKLNGDLGAITQYLEIILQTARNNGEPIPKNLKIKELFQALGVDSLRASGSSSKEVDNAWINLSYLEMGNTNKGIFSLIGEANQTPVVPTICPAETDLALQLQLDLRQLPPLLKHITNLSDKGREISKMEQNIPELNLTTSQLLSKLNVTVSLAIDINTSTAAQKNPFSVINGANAIARIDGLNWLWNQMEDQIIAKSKVPLEKSEQNGVITYKLHKDMENQLMGYSPLLVIDNVNNHIWISTNPAFYQKCKSGENTLANTEAFQAAMEHLPATANSMLYVSKGFLDTAKSQYNNAAENNLFGPDFIKGKKIVDHLMVDITESDKGWAMLLNKDDDGIMLASRGPVGLQHLNYVSSYIPIAAF